MRWLAVFLAVALADLLWTRYILAASDRRALAAAGYSAGIVVVGGFTTLAYVDSAWNLIPACLGAIVGTYWTVRHG